MIHVLVLWLIILHNTPFSKYKRNIPISFYIATGLIFVAKKKFADKRVTFTTLHETFTKQRVSLGIKTQY